MNRFRAIAFWALGMAALVGCASGRAASVPEITVLTLAEPRLYLAGPKPDQADRLVLNGPLFGTDGNPVGGSITRNGPDVHAPLLVQHVTRVIKGDGNFAWRNQIFVQRANGSFFMEPYDPLLTVNALMARDHATFMIQNGPALVVDGKNLHDPVSAHTASRIGIGFTKDNRLVIADSQREITMYELAEALRTNGAVDALYLDGNTNGFVAVDSKQGHLPQSNLLLHVQ